MGVFPALVHGGTVVTCRAEGSTMSAMTTLHLQVDGWTVDDLADLDLEEGLRCELVDGCLLVTPPPVVRHGHGIAQLCVLLSPALGDEWIVTTDSGIRFDDRNLRIPDVLVVRRAALGQALAAASDVLLAVEVMSPSSVSTDRVAKPAQYAAAGIPHFWRVEPDVLVTHALDGDTYRETGRFADEVVVDEPVALRFPLARLLG